MRDWLKNPGRAQADSAAAATTTAAALPPRAWLLKLFAVGLAVFFMGILVFVATGYYPGFTTTGVNNRTAIASAVGVALTTVAVVGLVSTLFRSPQSRRTFFGAAVAVLCASGFLIVNTVAAFWAEAARRQDRIVAEFRRQHPVLSDGAVVLFGGFEIYAGPAPVIECYWDAGGVLRTAYDDSSLRGDVANSRTAITADGVITTIYGERRFYPYGDRLFFYDARSHTLAPLKDAADAARLSPGRDLTAVEREGYGDPIF